VLFGQPSTKVLPIRSEEGQKQEFALARLKSINAPTEGRSELYCIPRMQRKGSVCNAA